MALEIDSRLDGWLRTLNGELDTRTVMASKLDAYHLGYPEAPEHVKQIKAEPEYRVLLRQAVTNWPELIVDSVEDRLEVTGFKFGGQDADDSVWEIWQRAGLDADSGLLHEGALVNGRAFAIVWSDGRGGVEIVPEHASTTVVAYDMPSRRRRAAALRRWEEGDYWYATLYLPDGIFKFRSTVKSGGRPDGTVPTSQTSNVWEMRLVDGEDWPLSNPLGEVPVVEFAVNRTLAPWRCSSDQLPAGPVRQARMFGSGSGEFEHVLPIIDRINTTIFSGLLAQTFSSFPVRALIGDPISYKKIPDSSTDSGFREDADGNVVEEAQSPIQMAFNRLIQIENPQGRLVQLPESSLDNYIKFAEAHIRHLAAITKTPAHYLLGEMVNLSADAIRASEAALIAKVGKHKLSLGEAHEDVMRLALRVIDPSDKRALVADAAIQWAPSESRSLAERADAATKLREILPPQALWEEVLNATPSQVNQWRSMATDHSLQVLLAAAASTSSVPGNGNGLAVPAG